jgi:hypothetical protein
MSVNERLLDNLYSKYKVSSVDELDELMYSRLKAVIELVQDIEQAGLDNAKHFSLSTALIDGLSK